VKNKGQRRAENEVAVSDRHKRAQCSHDGWEMTGMLAGNNSERSEFRS